jgi:hypothetical protein
MSARSEPRYLVPPRTHLIPTAYPLVMANLTIDHGDMRGCWYILLITIDNYILLTPKIPAPIDITQSSEKTYFIQQHKP